MESFFVSVRLQKKKLNLIVGTTSTTKVLTPLSIFVQASAYQKVWLTWPTATTGSPSLSPTLTSTRDPRFYPAKSWALRLTRRTMKLGEKTYYQ